MTMVRDESDEILSQANHCLQKTWTMRLEKQIKERLSWGG